MKLKYGRHAYDQKSYDATLAKSAANSIAKQVECGIDIVTDGEFSKPGFFTYICERLEGLKRVPIKSFRSLKSRSPPFRNPIPSILKRR